MIGIPESELSRAQADVEPRLNARVNCGPVKCNNNLHLFALVIMQRKESNATAEINAWWMAIVY